MKTTLNITIEDAVLAHVREYAASRDISVSQMVEDYFQSLTKSVKRNNIIEMVEGLETPAFIDEDLDLKKAYYDDKSEKYCS
jgi:hypothetical protein